MQFAKKSLGQNFLIDKNIIKKIINIIDIENKNKIEIGFSKGALTNEIIKKKKEFQNRKNFVHKNFPILFIKLCRVISFSNQKINNH